MCRINVFGITRYFLDVIIILLLFFERQKAKKFRNIFAIKYPDSFWKKETKIITEELTFCLNIFILQKFDTLCTNKITSRRWLAVDMFVAFSVRQKIECPVF